VELKPHGDVKIVRKNQPSSEASMESSWEIDGHRWVNTRAQSDPGIGIKSMQPHENAKRLHHEAAVAEEHKKEQGDEDEDEDKEEREEEELLDVEQEDVNDEEDAAAKKAQLAAEAEAAAREAEARAVEDAIQAIETQANRDAEAKATARVAKLTEGGGSRKKRKSGSAVVTIFDMAGQRMYYHLHGVMITKKRTHYVSIPLLAVFRALFGPFWGKLSLPFC
jgi:hypothetical protein